jgi:L-lactate utilization protein LutC
MTTTTTEAATMTTAEPADTTAATSETRDWASVPDDATIHRTAEALRAKGYEVFLADDAGSARQIVLDKLPKGAEVSQGASKTLEETGITAAIEESGDYDAIRPKTHKLDYKTEEGRATGRKMGASPDWWINSAHAVTEDGRLVLASNTGSQLGPIAFGAGNVIFVIGAQKIVPDLDAAMRRIEEHVIPLENVRMQGLYGVNTNLSKLLIINKEVRPGRFTVVLVREPLGF